MSDETHLPNVISILRIAGSVSLLFCVVPGWPFWVLYALCGISDMVDVWLCIWAGVIVFIKMVNQVSALAVFKRFCFPHTWANKLTGFLLFLTVPTMFWSMIPISIVAALATFAAVQEGHFIRKK